MNYLCLVAVTQIERQVVLNVVGKLGLVFRIQAQDVD